MLPRLNLQGMLAPIVMILVGAAIAVSVFLNPETGKALALGLGGFLVGMGLLLALVRAGVVTSPVARAAATVATVALLLPVFFRAHC